MKTFKAPIKVTITIKRPNGEIEKVVHPTLKTINDSNFKVMKTAMKKAGKGDCLSYDIEYKSISGMSKSEMMRAGNDNTVDNMSRMGD